MARPTLTEEQKAKKAADLAEIQATKRHYNRRQSPEFSGETIAEPIVTTAESTDGTAAKGFTPFKGSRIKRSYSTPPIDQSLLTTEIPEAQTADVGSRASMAQQASTASQNIPSGNPASTQYGASQNNTTAVPNQVKPLEDPKDAGKAVEMALAGYEFIHGLGRMAIKMNDKNLLKMHQDGEIDINRPFLAASRDPLGKGQTIQQFFSDMNTTIDREFVVKDDFKKSITPPLTRIFQKRGFGASDEALVLGIVGKDIFEKGMMIQQFRSVLTLTVEHMKTNHADVMAEVQRQRQVERERHEQASQTAAEQLSKEKAARGGFKGPEDKQTKQEPDQKEIPLTETETVTESDTKEKGINLVISPAGPEGGKI